MGLASGSPLLYNQVLHIPSTDGVASVSLTSGTAQAIAVPTGARAVAFSFNADIWVSYGAPVAAVPSSYSSAGSTACAEFNPTIRYFSSTANTTAISVISANTCIGSVSFYS